MLKLISKNVLLSLIFKIAAIIFSILIVSLASDQSELLTQQVLLFQVSVGYFSIFDMGVPSHLKSKAYNTGENNSAVWLVWFGALSLIFVLLAYFACRFLFENLDRNAVVAAVFAAIFTRFSISYFQSRYNFEISYGAQIWIPVLLVVYLLAFDVLRAVPFGIFVFVFCVLPTLLLIFVTRPDFRSACHSWHQDLRGGMIFFGAQALTVFVFGLHEYLFVFSGETFLGWSVESRYYLLISAFGPVISNLFWAYLTHATEKQSVKVLFFAIGALLVWAGFVFVFRNAFFDQFWPEYRSLITDGAGLYIWLFYTAHTAILFISGYLYSIRMERSVFWVLCFLLVVRVATLAGDNVGLGSLTIYEANGILGVVAFVAFSSIFVYRFLKKERGHEFYDV